MARERRLGGKWKTKKLADGDTRERGAFEPTRKEVAALEREGGSGCPVRASSTGSRGVISYIYIIYFYLLCGDNQFTNIDTLWMKKIRTRGDGV